MKEGAYGVVYQDVTRNKGISAAAKGLYAYLSSFCGVSDECYPTVETITNEMSMTRDTFYRHINALVAAGVVEKRQTRQEGNKFGRTLYRVTHEVRISDFPFPDNSITESSISGKSISDNLETNINNINNNNININNNKTDYQQIADMYNATCVSFPRLTKLSEKRKRAINARMKFYTVEDFRKLFQMAEESSFLKGQNARNWSATFDWLISDSNMAKVLDGNYRDRQQSARTAPGQQDDFEEPSYYQYLGNRTPSPDDPFQ